MRTKVIQIILGAIYLPIGTHLYAIDTSAEEKTCAEIGFKPKTEKFASCVIELYERSKNISNPAQTNASDPDDAACQKYGFKRGTTPYAECRQQIDLARTSFQQRLEEHNAQLARYEEEKKRYEKAVEDERRRRMSAAMMVYGLGLASGMRPDEASARALGIQPPQRPRIHPELETYQHRITLPNGNVMNCRQNGTNPNIFCY